MIYIFIEWRTWTILGVSSWCGIVCRVKHIVTQFETRHKKWSAMIERERWCSSWSLWCWDCYLIYCELILWKVCIRSSWNTGLSFTPSLKPKNLTEKKCDAGTCSMSSSHVWHRCDVYFHKSARWGWEQHWLAGSDLASNHIAWLYNHLPYLHILDSHLHMPATRSPQKTIFECTWMYFKKSHTIHLKNCKASLRAPLHCRQSLFNKDHIYPQFLSVFSSGFINQQGWSFISSISTA